MNLWLFGLMLVSCSVAMASPLTTHNLRAENALNPRGVDVARPRLSWSLQSTNQGDRQSAYQIQVASSQNGVMEGEANLWESGKVTSSETLHIPYGGTALQSGQEAWWRVRAWDRIDQPGAWSRPRRWLMGVLSPEDWKARWIGAPFESPTVLFRREFNASKPIRRAIAFVTGLGHFELMLNGCRVWSDWVAPGWTQYGKTTLYETYNVTSALKAGDNAVALHVGNGMYDMSGDTRGAQQTRKSGDKKALCQLDITYEDGTRETWITDDTWKCSPSGATYSGVFGGEDWDARKDQRGYNRTEFDDSTWTTATEVDAPTGELKGLSASAPPLVLQDVREPVAATRPAPDTLVLDLGQNAPYVPKLTVAAPAGTTFVFKPAEVLKADGTIDQATIRPGKQVAYTCRGDGDETWWPRFWYVGCRYWQVTATGADGQPVDPEPPLKRFRGLMVYSASPEVGRFECSDALFNRTSQLIVWAIRSNLASVISDCPHREKSGWLEQIHLMGPGMMYSFDMSRLFGKTVNDMADAQQPDGMVPTMAPEYFLYEGSFRDSVEWGGAFLFLPAMMRAWYSESDPLRRHYDGMRRYIDYLGTRAKDGILSNGLGDWNGYGADSRTPVAVTDTAYYWRAARDLAGFAAELGHTDDAKKYGALAEAIRTAFNKAFVDATTGRVSTGSQSCQATALDLGLLDSEVRPAAFARLLEDVDKHDFAVSCGEVGHPSLLRALADSGRSDLVYRIHHQSDRPGYGWMLAKGCTTLTEAWDAGPISQNHFMLGHILEWFYRDLAGLRPGKSAWRSFEVRPQPVRSVTWARASFESPRGRIETRWATTDGTFEVSVLVPPGCAATVTMPSSLEKRIGPGRWRFSESYGPPEHGN